MDKPANQQSNPPLLNGSESTPKARPVFRVLAIVVAAVYFTAAAFIGFREVLGSAVLCAFFVVFVAIGVTGYAPFRHTPKNYASLFLLVATVFWAMILADCIAGHQQFWHWFDAVVLTVAAITTFRRERRERFMSAGNTTPNNS